MPKYAILVYETEQDITDRDRHMPAYTAYAEALSKAGIFAGGAGLQPQHTGTTLKIQNGQRQVQDGPYAETKEQIGGFFMIDVADLDEALDWAARCPAATNCAVEVRPLMLMDEA